MNDRPTRQWHGLTIPEPGVYLLDEAHKRIGFHAQHMMVSPVRGEFTAVTATITVGEDPRQSSVTATIQAASVDTSNAERDAHLRSPDFLDAARFRTLEFRSNAVQWTGVDDDLFRWARLRNNTLNRRSSAISLPEVAGGDSSRFLVAGDLTIKGVTQPVEMTFEYGGAGRDPYGRDIFGFSASAEIDRGDFGLVWNVALERGGVLVGRKVRIEISGEAVRQG